MPTSYKANYNKLGKNYNKLGKNYNGLGNLL